MESRNRGNQDSYIFWGKRVACPDQKPNRNQTMLEHRTSASPVWWLGRQHKEPAQPVWRLWIFGLYGAIQVILLTYLCGFNILIAYSDREHAAIVSVTCLLAAWLLRTWTPRTFWLSTCLMPLTGSGWLGRFRLTAKKISCDFVWLGCRLFSLDQASMRMSSFSTV